MHYLFFDTETTVLPKDWKASVTNLSNWPRLVQLAFGLYGDNGVKVVEGNYIIKPEGFIIPEASSDVHGITHERALKEGQPLEAVLNKFVETLKKSNVLVAHNMSFDEKILGAELLRNNMPNHIDAMRKVCTIQSTTNFCQIPGNYGYKWSTLQELHSKLFGRGFEDAHDAYVDVAATVKCFLN